MVPRVPNRRFLTWDPSKLAFEGIADQKIALSCLSHVLASGPKNEPNSMCMLDPKTGAAGSPVFPGHDRDPLRCFSGCAGKELRFEGCRSDVGLTVPEIWPFP